MPTPKPVVKKLSKQFDAFTIYDMDVVPIEAKMLFHGSPHEFNEGDIIEPRRRNTWTQHLPEAKYPKVAYATRDYQVAKHFTGKPENMYAVAPITESGAIAQHANPDHTWEQPVRFSPASTKSKRYAANTEVVSTRGFRVLKRL